MAELKIDFTKMAKSFEKMAKERGLFVGWWIPVSEGLPNHDEYIKNNGWFNVTDGNRSYPAWFDIYDTQKFGEATINGFRVDYAVTAWMPLPEPYNAENEDKG